jgi:hypothetical protein
MESVCRFQCVVAERISIAALTPGNHPNLTTAKNAATAVILLIAMGFLSCCFSRLHSPSHRVLKDNHLPPTVNPSMSEFEFAAQVIIDLEKENWALRRQSILDCTPMPPSSNQHPYPVKDDTVHRLPLSYP